MKKVTVQCFPTVSTLLILLCTKPTLVCFSLCLCLYLTLCDSSIISTGFVLVFFACLLINTNDPTESSSNAMTIQAW